MLTEDKVVDRITKDERVYPSEILQQMGGEWLGSIRNWIQWNASNGSDVTWGSHEYLKLKSLTVSDLEALAAQIALATLRQFKNNLATKNNIRALAVYANPDNWIGTEFIPDFEKLHWRVCFKQSKMEKGSDIALWYSEIV